MNSTGTCVPEDPGDCTALTERNQTRPCSHLRVAGGRAEVVETTVLFLASDETSYITGAEL